MAEPKECNVMVRLEPTFRVLLSKLERESGLPASTYMRRLLIEELQRKGMLTQQILLRVTTMSPTEVTRLVEAVEAKSA